MPIEGIEMGNVFSQRLIEVLRITASDGGDFVAVALLRQRVEEFIARLQT